MVEAFYMSVNESGRVTSTALCDESFGCKADTKECLVKLVGDEAPFFDKVHAVHKYDKISSAAEAGFSRLVPL